MKTTEQAIRDETTTTLELINNYKLKSMKNTIAKSSGKLLPYPELEQKQNNSEPDWYYGRPGYIDPYYG